MLCDKCGKNQATTHYKQTVNGTTQEYHLCSDCAKNLASMPGKGLFDFSDILGTLFGQTYAGRMISAGGKQPACPNCGLHFNEIAQTGKVGCAQCYETFYEEFLPSIQRIHGKTAHNGKVPRSAGARLRLRSEIDTLKNQLKTAVDSQEFEKACEIRDRIQKLEKGEEDHA